MASQYRYKCAENYASIFSLKDAYQQKKCKAVTLQAVPAAASAAACTKHGA
jgi:hypothetical protein